jgi:hypothetical protein
MVLPRWRGGAGTSRPRSRASSLGRDRQRAGGEGLAPRHHRGGGTSSARSSGARPALPAAGSARAGRLATIVAAGPARRGHQALGRHRQRARRGPGGSPPSRRRNQLGAVTRRSAGTGGGLGKGREARHHRGGGTSSARSPGARPAPPAAFEIQPSAPFEIRTKRFFSRVTTGGGDFGGVTRDVFETRQHRRLQMVPARTILSPCAAENCADREQFLSRPASNLRIICRRSSHRLGVAFKARSTRRRIASGRVGLSSWPSRQASSASA